MKVIPALSEPELRLSGLVKELNLNRNPNFESPLVHRVRVSRQMGLFLHPIISHRYRWPNLVGEHTKFVRDDILPQRHSKLC